MVRQPASGGKYWEDRDFLNFYLLYNNKFHISSLSSISVIILQTCKSSYSAAASIYILLLLISLNRMLQALQIRSYIATITADWRYIELLLAAIYERTSEDDDDNLFLPSPL